MKLSRRFGLPIQLVATILLLAFACGDSFNTVAIAGTFETASSRDLLEIRNKIRAAQFLSKATFGPTQAEIDTLATRMGQIGVLDACDEWIEDQLALPASSQKQTALDIIALDGNEPTDGGKNIARYRYQAWWHIALTGEDQLRQRVAYALSQIFVIGHTGNQFNSENTSSANGQVYTEARWLGMSDYYDMLAGNAFGSYRELLGDVTFHPCMGVWLSHVRNRKANVGQGRFPDENYAREIMQLFSIGLYLLEQDGQLQTTEQGELIPTYDNEEIVTLARLFTGFRYAHPTSTSLYTNLNYTEPMAIRHQDHDDNKNYSEVPNAPEEKRIFGVTLPPLNLGSLPNNQARDQACADEINSGLDVIADHGNVAPFICRLLIQRLVKSNPSRAYMNRVTSVFNDNGDGERGDLKAVVKAILLDPEVFRGQRLLKRSRPNRLAVISRGSEYSRLREPVLRISAMIRALNPSSDYAGGYMMLHEGIGNDLGQHPYRSPTVFNFYLPEYQPSGDLIGYSPSSQNPAGALYAPEFQILTAVTANRTSNKIRSMCRSQYVQYTMRGSLKCRISFNLDDELSLAQSMDTVPDLIERLDLLLCNGSMSDESRQSIYDAIEEVTATNGGSRIPEYRMEQALLAVLVSPDCAIDE